MFNIKHALRTLQISEWNNDNIKIVVAAINSRQLTMYGICNLTQTFKEVMP